MHDDLKKLLRQYPCIAAKTDEPGLLSEQALAKVRVSESSLFRRLRRRQRRTLARLSPDMNLRKLAEPADRFRDVTRAHPLAFDCDFAWREVFVEPVADGDLFYSVRKECRQLVDTLEQRDRLLALYNTVRLELAQALSRPAPVFEDRHAVRVEFLDSISFVALKIEREIRLEIREMGAGWQLSSQRFDLLKPLHRPSWIELFLVRWLDDIVLAFDANAEDAWGWLLEKLKAEFHKDEVLDGIRRQVRQHVCVNPGMLEAAKVIKMHTGGTRFVMNTEIGDMWLKADFWAELYDKYPDLVMLCDFATKSSRVGGIDDVSEIRARCLEAGLSPAGWRFLLRNGESSYGALLDLGITGVRAFSIAVDFIEWQTRTGLKEPMPLEPAQAVVSFAALQGDRPATLCEQIDPRFGPVVMQHYATLEDSRARAAFVGNDCLEILVWLRDAKPRIGKNQWKAGWASLWRSYEASFTGEDHKREWNSRVPEMTVEGLRVVPLTSSVALCLEGMRMKNCVASYADVCKKGNYRVFSIREISSEKRVATVGLERRRNTWVLDQVKAKCNRAASKAATELAQSLAKTYQESHERYFEAARCVEPSAYEAARASIRGILRHVGISAEYGLLLRNAEGNWQEADPADLPLSDALQRRLQQQREDGGTSAIGDLAIALRLELPREYRVFIWDENGQRFRLLTLR